MAWDDGRSVTPTNPWGNGTSGGDRMSEDDGEGEGEVGGGGGGGGGRGGGGKK